MDTITKNPVGRPATADPPYDKECYFSDYYRRNKKYVVCDCKQLVLKSNLSRHLKTDKHLTYIVLTNQENEATKNI